MSTAHSPKVNITLDDDFQFNYCGSEIVCKRKIKLIGEQKQIKLQLILNGPSNIITLTRSVQL